MLILQLCKSTAYYRNGYMNNYCVVLSKVRKRRLNWREWKNMTVQASARDPGLRSPGRQKSRENHENHGKMLILAYTWIILWYVARIEPLTSFAFKLAYQNEKKEHMIHINTHQYISIHIMHLRKISQEGSSSAELATQESWNLASESKRTGPA